jgi:CRP/FNR family transcriptional regulator
MNSKLFKDISKDEVFSHLSSRDHEELARLTFSKKYRKGQYICMQDDIWEQALYIKSGKLGWVMLSPDGKCQVVFRMGIGRVVWGHSLFDGKPMPAALEVMEDCEVCIWDGSVIMPILSRNVDAVWAITGKLVGIMRRVRDVVYGFAFHPVAGRMAHFLLNHYKDIDGQVAPRDLTLDEMAQTIGTTRELVSKTLHQFASEGMIEVSRVEIIFTDRGKLEKLVNE